MTIALDQPPAEAAQETTMPVRDDQLSTISNLAFEQLRLEGLVADIEEQLKKAKNQLRQVAQIDLPEAMAAVRLRTFTLDNGDAIEIRKDLKLSVPKSRKHDIVQWLIDKGFGALVKDVVTVAFEKGNYEAAAKLQHELEQGGYKASVAEDVNTTSLKALLRERMSEGDVIDLEWFGGFEFTEAVIEKAK